MKFQVTNIDFSKSSYSRVEVVDANDHFEALAKFNEMSTEELMSETQPQFTETDNENLKYLKMDGEGVVVVLKMV
jgi:hypothetical protein